MNFKKFHESRNLINVQPFTIQANDGTQRIGLYTGTLPVGEYTLSLMQDDSLTGSTRNTLVVRKNTVSYATENASENYHNASGLHRLIFTVDDSTANFELQMWAHTLSNKCTYSNIMLNTGSTPLPYEPYSSEVWHDIPHYIHNTSTDTITTPADIYANDTTATVGLKGNMYQASGVSPTTPIQPQETGEKTGNLFDWNWLVNGYHLDPQTGLPTTHPSRVSILQPIDVSQLTTATISYESIDVETLYAMYSVLTTENTLIRRVTSVASGSTLDLSGGDKLYIAFYNGASSGATAITKDNITNIMLNLGSTALPYEPYGQYKIPISSASTTTPVYLGEVETTRKIRKWVLDGSEAWSKGNYPPTGGYQFFTARPADIAANYDWIITHFVKGIVLNGSAFASYLSLYPEVSILPENAKANDFKAWLAAQYAAGTPVTIWYVLANDETGIVNEPLMKIGDYADTVSGITVPTITGKDTFDVETTLKPSEVSLSYTGWHDAMVEEWDGSQWNE